jgi:aryl-alcohol dehydrogenase
VTRIRAAVVERPGAPFELQELELAGPRPDELLVEVAAVGLCHTDLVARDGDYPVPTPAVFGHEGAGIVREVGAAVADFAPGDKVLMSFAACHRCAHCRGGRPSYCKSAFEYNFGCARADGSSALSRAGERVHGHFFGQSSFATAALVAAADAVPVAPDADLTLLAPLGCGIQTGAGAVLRSLRPSVGSSIAIFGTGAVGLSAVMAARVAGCSPIVAVDLHADRLRLAAELGADATIVSGEAATTVATIQEATGGEGVDHALDTTGNPTVVRTAVDSLALAGTFGLIGASKEGTEVSLDMTHMLFGRTFRGIIEGDSVPQDFIPELIALQAAGRFPFERLIEHFPLDEINRAAELSLRGDLIKPVLVPQAKLARLST